MRQPDIPWNKCEYYLDTDSKTIYLRGSFMRAMALHHRDKDPVPGYEVKLIAPSTLEKLKDDSNYINELKQIIQERENDKEDEYTKSYRSFDR